MALPVDQADQARQVHPHLAQGTHRNRPRSTRRPATTRPRRRGMQLAHRPPRRKRPPGANHTPTKVRPRRRRRVPAGGTLVLRLDLQDVVDRQRGAPALGAAGRRP